MGNGIHAARCNHDPRQAHGDQAFVSLDTSKTLRNYGAPTNISEVAPVMRPNNCGSTPNYKNTQRDDIRQVDRKHDHFVMRSWPITLEIGVI